MLRMVTNVLPMLAEESSVAIPQKIAKIDEKIRNCSFLKFSWPHCFRLTQSMNYPIPRVTSAAIRSMG
jgi:hypothetical protein